MKLKQNKRVTCGILVTVLLLSLLVSKGLSKADGNVVLEYTFTNNKVGNASGTIKLTSSSATNNGTYDIYWADAAGKLSEYEKITSLSVGDSNSASYKMLSLNAIPDGVTKIVAMKNNTVAAQYNIPESKLIKANKKFSFGALSDIHLDGDGSDETKSNSDFQNELDYFKSKNVSLICNSGDITLDGRDSDLKAVVSKISSAGIPIYTARGNHDSRNACSSLSEWSKIEPNGLIFEKTVNNEVFVFLGMNKEDYKDTFSSEQLAKLEEILERNKNKRVFLFEHVFFGEVGNVKGLYPYSSLSDSGTAGEFKNIMKKYQNVISFTGHSHLDFELQRISENANICEKDGSYGYRVHCPSASKPRKNDADTEDVSSNTYTYEEGALGYLVDVYEDYIVLKGRDFTKNINLPYATYILHTGSNSSGGDINSNINTDSTISNSDTNVDSEITTTITPTEVVSVDNYTGDYNSSDTGINTNTNSDTNTNTQASTYSNAGTTDIMLVIDKSISYDNRFNTAKSVAKSFVNNMLQKQSVNIGVVEFGLNATTSIGLSNSSDIVNKAIDNVNLQDGVSGSNMHAGVCKAIEELKSGSASNKVIIIISDGRTNRTIDDTKNHNRDKSRAAVKNELDSAKNMMENLKVVTLDYSKEDDSESKDFLQSIASISNDGSKMYYTNGTVPEVL